MLEHMPAFELLAHQIGISMPNLFGYMGVDVQIQQNQGKTHYAILDINPRLTTSYVGLHQAMQVNPASCLLSLANQELQLPAFAHQRVMVNIEGALN
jgi:predicted ATP-grasp superfamily ATP-dependent carboligase